MYVKGHSQGEYIFDHGWADAYERAGGQYYPKLQVAVPFTPVPGPRLLTHGSNPDVREALIGALRSVAEQSQLSSLHVTFCTEEEAAALREAGFLHRIGLQYHFDNPGYGSFDDFLSALSSRKRKSIRKEREAIKEYGLTIQALSGAEITPRHWDAFFAFYMDTGSRKWGHPYLNREFFSLLSAAMADRIVLMFAYDGSEPIAGTLSLIGRDTLYGRYWGATREQAFLHFELCYYQAIDFALARGLTTVEAGAQGQHKLARGYAPATTRSIHWIGHPGLRHAVAGFLEQERGAVDHEQRLLHRLTPFRRGE
jgi:hypothetical protein